MYCNRCGNPLQPNQSTCAQCGSVVIAPPPLSRVEQHRRLVGVLWLAYSSFHFIGGIILLAVANTIFAPYGPARGAPEFLRPFLSFIAVLIFVKGAVGLAAGYGLLQRLSWARIVTLVLAFISLLNIPFGTVLGIYTLWVLLSPGAEAEFQQRAAPA